MNGDMHLTMEENTDPSLSPESMHASKKQKTSHGEESDSSASADGADPVGIGSENDADKAESGSEGDESDDSLDSEENAAAEKPKANDVTSGDESGGESIDSSKNKTKGDSDGDDSEAENEENGTGAVHEVASDSESEEGEVKPANNTKGSEMYSDDEDSTEEEGSADSEEDGQKTAGANDDPVSIDSDSEPEAVEDESSKDSDENTNNRNSTEILLVDDLSNQADDKSRDSGDEEVHEIVSDNDDCIMTEDKVLPDKPAEQPEPENVRRSSRNIERKSYKEPDKIEELIVEKKKPVEKKPPTVVIIDTNSILSGRTPLPISKPISVNTNTMPSKALYQSIAARGITVTPIPNKPAAVQPAAPPPALAPLQQPNILPSLTDDMFVVEAPSFIIPFVYEKPSVKPFREFVDTLGKELEEVRLKEEQKRMEKEKEIKEKLEKERKERGEPEIIEKDDKAEKLENKDKEKEDGKAEKDKDESSKKKKPDKRARRKRNDDDDASWDEESSSDSEDVSDDDKPKVEIIKEKEDDSLEVLKDPIAADSAAPVEAVKSAVKSDNYFDNSLGKFFFNIGVNLVQEYVQSDLLKQQKHKLRKENRTGFGNVKATEASISSLLKNLQFSKETNAPFKFQQKQCEYCSFKTELSLVMAHHMETPHMTNNVYKCNFCTAETRSPHDILYHLATKHNTRGRLERAPASHQCPNCAFEDNTKGKLARHSISCAKKFKPDFNLAPPLEWEPPAKIQKITRGRQSAISPYQAALMKSQMVGVRSNMLQRGTGRPAMQHAANSLLIRGSQPGNAFRQAHPTSVPNAYQLMSGGQTTIKYSAGPAAAASPALVPPQPSVSITRGPRPRAPAPAPATTASNPKATFVICEVCDGYIKDLDQLRHHMQWIHKVKIHPKMIYNRPPLNCQKCQFRFFTDQGLERHLLGSHGLVTSSMQDAANKGKDAGRCPACGKVYPCRLLNHVARDHNMVLKPAHLSYKCTVCTATFGMYKEFESHVYSAHSVVARRVVDRTRAPVKTPL